MSPRHPLTRRSAPARLLAVTAVLTAGLTGCGLTDTSFRPGVAAEVGGETIGVDEVDEVATSLCDVIASDERLAGRSFANTQLRTIAAHGLVMRAMGEQLLEEHDVTLPEGVQDGAEEVRASYAAADPEDLDKALPAFTGPQHLFNVLLAIGGQDADAAGSDAGGAAALARGAELAEKWQAEAGVEMNPAFDRVVIDADQVAPEGEPGRLPIVVSDDELSVPASEFAQQALAGEETWAASLPESQRCTAQA